MKKIILSAVAVLAFGFTNAQVKFGAKAALNVATLTGDTEGASSLIGFQIGGFAEIKVSEKFAIQPELMYSAQGSSYDEGGDDKFDYLNIPVMAKFYVADAFSLEAGPQIGFLLSAKSDGTDVKDFITSTDFGLNLGAGYDFTENLSAGLRYNFGLSNVSDIDFEGEDFTVNNAVLSVSLGYKF